MALMSGLFRLDGSGTHRALGRGHDRPSDGQAYFVPPFWWVQGGYRSMYLARVMQEVLDFIDFYGGR